MKRPKSGGARRTMPSRPSRVNRRTMLMGAVGAVGGVLLIGGATGVIPLGIGSANADRGQVTLYKNPQCGCCEGYASYLRDNGFAVNVVPTNDLLIMGQKYGIPDDLAPCHISLIGDYVIGGHVPIEPINRLLSEKPQITGINLPGMPQGTPGMPGKKPGRLAIYEIGKAPPKVYATV